MSCSEPKVISSIQNTPEKSISYWVDIRNIDNITDNDFRVLESRYNQLLDEVYFRYQRFDERDDEDLVEIVNLVKRKFKKYRDSLSNLLSTSPRPSYFQVCCKAIYIDQRRWLKVLESYLIN